MQSTIVILFAIFCASVCAVHAKYRFTNIAANPSATGLHYRRAPSALATGWRATLKDSLKNPIPGNELPTLPWDVHGQPGVAVGDFNNDGVDDIFVTNGPGRPNSLFINRFPKTNKLVFQDIAVKAGIASTEQDSTGVCYGDLNSDGIVDFVVLSAVGHNQIFLGEKDGTFRLVSWVSATGNDKTYPSSTCSIGDVNSDGHLDLFIANSILKDNALGCLAVPYELNPPNQLFINQGVSGNGLKFKDVSFSCGINDYGGSIPKDKYTITWAAALVDIDQDGNLDVVMADDQCGLPIPELSPSRGARRGGIRVQYGDGTGKFVSQTLKPVNARKNNRYEEDGNWMGLGFGDFNCDGKIDLFGSNAGDYHGARFSILNGTKPDDKPGKYSSRWWLQTDFGQKFIDASIEMTGVTVFAWGNAVFDYDNDGDQDVVTAGSLDFSAFAGSANPNTIYKNIRCKGKFAHDLKALEPTGSLRNYRGVAIGDFNMDGYPDVVAASGYVTKANQRTLVKSYQSPYDRTGFFTEILKPTVDGSGWVWTGNELNEGDMMVQINRATDEGTCWVSVRPLGSKGLISAGKVNRGGLGAIITVKPYRRKAVIAPVVGGESFGSQHSPRKNFGLGPECGGLIEIWWPGGVRNRLYGAKHEDMVTFPEIPCSFSRKWKTESDYNTCVSIALLDLVRKKVISSAFSKRLESSARKARKRHLRVAEAK